MGRNHCLNDSCATVWLKKIKRSEKIVESICFPNAIVYAHRSFTGRQYINFFFDNVYFKYVEGNECCFPARWDGQRYRGFNQEYYDIDYEIKGYTQSGYPTRTPRYEEPRRQSKILVGSFGIDRSVSYYESSNTEQDRICELIPANPPARGEGSDYATELIIYSQAPIKKTTLEVYDCNTDRLIQSIVGLNRLVFDDGSVSVEYPIVDDRQGNISLRTSRVSLTDLIYEIREEEIIEYWESYKIEKKPWFERLEVVDFAYNFSSLGILDLSRNILEPFSPIDSNCLNVYVTSNISDLIIPPIAPTGYVEPTFPFETELKYQLCTGKENTKPEYYVTCGCEPECPPGTCQVDCGDRICCYDSNGIAVAEIRLE